MQMILGNVVCAAIEVITASKAAQGIASTGALQGDV